MKTKCCGESRDGCHYYIKVNGKRELACANCIGEIYRGIERHREKRLAQNKDGEIDRIRPHVGEYYMDKASSIY